MYRLERQLLAARGDRGLDFSQRRTGAGAEHQLLRLV